MSGCRVVGCVGWVGLVTGDRLGPWCSYDLEGVMVNAALVSVAFYNYPLVQLYSCIADVLGLHNTTTADYMYSEERRYAPGILILYF